MKIFLPQAFVVLISILFVYPSVSQAAKYDYIVKCQSPLGIRLDYLSAPGNLKLQKNRFLLDDDKLNVELLIGVRGNIAVILLSRKDAIRRASGGTLKKLLHDNEQASFVGVLRDAPVMLTIYPAERSIVMTQHSYWILPMRGLRVTTFYSSCTFQTNVTEVTESK